MSGRRFPSDSTTAPWGEAGADGLATDLRTLVDFLEWPAGCGCFSDGSPRHGCCLFCGAIADMESARDALLELRRRALTANGVRPRRRSATPVNSDGERA